MKKTLSVLVVLLALGAAGGAVYLFQKGNRPGGASSAAVGGYLPAETLLLLSLPDLNQTVADWKTTDLYKIWTEPQIQAFFAKPLSKLPADADFNATLTRIAKIEPRNAFIALTSLDEKTNQPHLVAGFEFKGSSADVDALIAPAKDSLRRSTMNGKADLINYQGHPVETFDDGNGKVGTSVYVNDWYLVGNDVALLESTIDRLEHRAPASDKPALDKDADYQAVLAKLPAEHATLIFARVQPFMSRIYALAAASGQTIDPAQQAEAAKIHAVGATTRIENGKLRDTIYDLAPGHRSPPATLGMTALPLASTDTLFFATGVLTFPDHLDLPAADASGASAAPGAAGLASLRELAAMLDAHGLKLADLRAAFGNEGALQLDWAANSAQPRLLASLDVRDSAKAGKFVDNLTNTLDAEAAWQVSHADGLTFHTLASPGVSFVSPTLTLTDKHLVLGLNPPEVHDAARREKTPAPNFTGSETYKAALATVSKPNEAFAYLDSKTFFERAYGALKPFAMLGTAFMFPQSGDYVDLAKLPDAETISKHLSPAVLSESSDDAGILLESVGSFTYGEAVVAVAGAAGAVAVPMLEKQYGLHLGATPAPSASPGSSPAQSGTDQ